MKCAYKYTANENKLFQMQQFLLFQSSQQQYLLVFAKIVFMIHWETVIVCNAAITSTIPII